MHFNCVSHPLCILPLLITVKGQLILKTPIKSSLHCTDAFSKCIKQQNP